jgi:5-methyltetrahydrofolate--homocysteine methyltransferase
MLQARGLAPGENTASWNLTHFSDVVDIHRQYLEAGADIITANTFSIFQAENSGRLITKAVEAARQAIADTGRDSAFIAYDIGPSEQLMEPMGSLGFDTCLNEYRTLTSFAKAQGVGLFLIETMTDLYQLKAAAIAAIETGLPVLCSMAFEQNGRTLTGASPACLAALAEGLGACAVGLNCGFGPEQALDILPRFVEATGLPITAQPNAGLPQTIDGKTVYMLKPDTFAREAKQLVQNGARLVGGCCGTTPEHIRATVETCRNLPLLKRQANPAGGAVICSGSMAVSLSEGAVQVGDGLDGSRAGWVQKAALSGDMEAILDEAFDEADNGADIIRIHTGLGADEGGKLAAIVQAIQEVIRLPLAIAPGSPDAAETALRLYNGRPLLELPQAASGSTLEQYGKIAKKYGAYTDEYNHWHRYWR